MESMFCLYFSGFGYTMITLHSKIDKRRAWHLGYLKGKQHCYNTHRNQNGCGVFFLVLQ